MSSADRKGAIAVSANWLRTWPRRYGFAVFVVVAASVARYVLGLTLGFLPPFVTFFLAAIILVALLAGLGPGIFATFLSAISIASFFWTWAGMFGNSRLKEFVWLVFLCGFGSVISALANLYRRHEATRLELERVFEGTEDMIVVVDRDYRYVIANHAFLKYRGIQKEDLIGRHVRDVLNPRVFETVKEKLDECFQGKVVQYEMRYTYPIRGERDLRITYFPIVGSGGVDRVASILEDITGQKRTDRSLQLFRTLIDQSNDAVEVIDPETLCFLDVNEKACTELGYTREEMLSLAMYDVDPLVNDPYRATFVEKLKNDGSINCCGTEYCDRRASRVARN